MNHPGIPYTPETAARVRLAVHRDRCVCRGTLKCGQVAA